MEFYSEMQTRAQSVADIDLVIFDCDGVLVDSEIIACLVDAAELRKINVELSDDEAISKFSGVSDKDMRSIIEREFNTKLPEDFFEKTSKIAAERLKSELREIPGIKSAVQSLPYAKCVASSSLPAKIDLCLSKVGLIDWFKPHIFSTALVKHGKPAPDIFLYAAQAFGVSPERCVVIEDSVAGVTAARAAGMRSIGFHGGAHCNAQHPARLKQAGATVLLGHMNGLLFTLDEMKTGAAQSVRPVEAV